MRYVCMLVVAVVLSVLWVLPVQARPMRRHYSIELTVPCIDTAMQIIAGLDGHNLDMSGGGAQGGWVSLTRRVNEYAFFHVRDVLRSLGTVTAESENATYLGAQLLATATQLYTTEQEMERLLAMLAASDSLSVLMAVDGQLAHVSRRRDALVGQRHLLSTQAASAVLHVWMAEEGTVAPWVHPPFFRRVADSFWEGVQAAQRVAGNALVLAVRISIPVVLWGTLLAVAAWQGLRVYKKHAGKTVVKEETP